MKGRLRKARTKTWLSRIFHDDLDLYTRKFNLEIHGILEREGKDNDKTQKFIGSQYFARRRRYRTQNKKEEQ